MTSFWPRSDRFAGTETGNVLVGVTIALVALIIPLSIIAWVAGQQSEQTAQAGPKAKLVSVGPVTAEDTDNNDTLDLVKFKLTLGRGHGSLDLSPAATMVTYTDINNDAVATFAPGVGADESYPVYWTRTWPVPGTGGPSLDRGEVVEFAVGINRLAGGESGAGPLSPNTSFTIQVLHKGGSHVRITRTIPLETGRIVNLN